MEDLFSCTCPCCGGSLKFQASLQKIKCEYCDTEFEVSDLKELNDSSNTIEENTEWTSEATDEFNESDAFNVYLCETCGGEVLCDENPKKVNRMGINDVFGKSGNAKQLMEYFKIDSKAIYEKILDLLERK